MKKWRIWLEENEEKEINSILDTAFRNIDGAFSFLQKSINKSFGKNAIPFAQEYKQSIIADLKKILNKLGVSDIRQESYINETDAHVSNVLNISPQASGRFSVKDVINSLKDKLKQVVKDAVYQAKGLSTPIFAPSQPTTGSYVTGIKTSDELENARDSIQILRRAQIIAPDKFTLSNRSPESNKAGSLNVDFDNPASIEQALQRLRKNRILKVGYGNKYADLDVTNTQSVYDFLQNIGIEVDR